MIPHSEHLAMETEGSKPVYPISDPILERIANLERHLEGANWRRVISLTAEKIGRMEPHELKALHDWACNRQAMLDRQVTLMTRHMIAERGPPQFLRHTFATQE